MDGEISRENGEIYSSGVKSLATLILSTNTFFGKKFVKFRLFRSHHNQMLMDFDFFKPPCRFFVGTSAEVEVNLDNSWY